MFVQLQNKLVLFSDPRIIEMFLDNVFITNKSNPVTREYVLNITKGENITGAKIYTAVEIGDNAFSNNTMASLNAPNVIKIGNSAFLNCTQLNNPTVSNILYLGQSAFSGCSLLESFDATHLSDATLHDYAFMNCTNLTDLDGLYGLSVIGNGALKNCNKLNVRFMNFTNAKKTLEFGENALYGVNWLDEEINLDNIQLDSIINKVAGLFAGNQTIKHAKITSKLNGTTADMFANCLNLETFDSSTLTALNPGTCVNCVNLTSINCPSVQKIPNYKTTTDTETTILPAFYNTPKLESVTMPNLTECVYFDNTSITAANFPKITALEPAKISDDISVYGFSGCSKLQTFSYDNFAELTSIGSKAFADCTSLTSINIGDKVSYIAEDAFQNDAKTLQTINIKDTNSRYSNQLSGTTKGTSKTEAERVKTGKNFIYDKTTKAIVLGCGNSEVNAVYTTNATYKDKWNDYVTKIGPYAFRGCNNLGSTIKWNLDNVTNIGRYAFAENSNFKTNNILSATTANTALTVIDEHAFDSTTGDTKDFNFQPDYIGEKAFYSSPIVKSLTFSAKKKISGIGPSAFMNCTNLTAVTNLGANNTAYRVLSVGEYAFYNSGIKSLTYYLGAGTELPDPYNHDVMGQYAFANNKSLQNVTIGYGTCLNDHTFDGCTELTSVTFKIAYESFFGSYVFANCTKLNTFTMQASDSKTGNIGLGVNMFYNCTGLKKLTIPKNANTDIMASAFNKCTNLATITFNDSACKTIGALAFNECENLKTLTLNKQINTFNSLNISALYGSSLTSVSMPGMPDTVFAEQTIDPVIVSATDVLSTQLNDFRYGVWYGWAYNSLTAAYEFATANNIPVVLLAISPRNGNCKYCNKWFDSVWDNVSFQNLVQSTNAIFIMSNNDNSQDNTYIKKQFSGFGVYPNLAIQTTAHSKQVIASIWGADSGTASYALNIMTTNIAKAVEGYTAEDKYKRDYSGVVPVSIDKNNAWGVQHDCEFKTSKHTYKWNFANQTFEQ